MLPAVNRLYAAAASLLSRELTDDHLKHLEAVFLKRDLPVPVDLTATLLERGLEPDSEYHKPVNPNQGDYPTHGI